MPNGEEALLSGEEEGSVVCVCVGGVFSQWEMRPR